MADSAAAPTSLTLARCGQCGYWLQGLSTAGVCPECGTAYDGSGIFLLGWGRGSHANILSTRGSGGVVWYVVMLCLMGQPFELLKSLQTLPVITAKSLVALLAILVPIVASVFLRVCRLEQETIRCELCAAGVRQDTFGGSRWLAVIVPSFLFLPILASNMVFRPWLSGWQAIAVMGAFVAFFGLILGLTARGQLRAMATLVPWNDVKDVLIQREKGGRCFLRITSERSRRGFLDISELVCAEVILSEEQEAELRSRCGEWQKLAGPVEGFGQAGATGRVCRSSGRLLGRALRSCCWWKR